MRIFWLLFGAIGLALVLGLHSCDEDDKLTDGGSGGADKESEVEIEINGEADVEKIALPKFNLTVKNIGDKTIDIKVSDGCPVHLFHLEDEVLTNITYVGAENPAGGDFLLVRYDHLLPADSEVDLSKCELIVGEEEFAIELLALDPEAECNEGEEGFPLCGTEILVAGHGSDDPSDNMDFVEVIALKIGVGVKGAEGKVKLYIANDDGRSWTKHDSEVSWGDLVTTSVSWNYYDVSHNLVLLNSMVGEEERWDIFWAEDYMLPSLLKLQVTEEAKNGAPFKLRVIDAGEDDMFALKPLECVEGGAKVVKWENGEQPVVEGVVDGVVLDDEGHMKDVYTVATMNKGENCQLTVMDEDNNAHGLVVFDVGEWGTDENDFLLDVEGVEWESIGTLVIKYAGVPASGNFVPYARVKVGDAEGDEYSVITDGEGGYAIRVSITPCPDAGTEIWVKIIHIDEDADVVKGVAVGMFEMTAAMCGTVSLQ